MKPVSLSQIAGFFVAALLLAAAPAAAQRDVARPALTPVVGTPKALSDVSSSYDQMEKNLEQQYAKLIKDAKDQKSALEDKIKDLETQIKNLKENAKRIERVAQKMEELLPQLLAALGSDSGGGTRLGTSKSGKLADFLGSELSKAGIQMSGDQIKGIADAITKGGQAGIGVALQIATQIADASAGVPSSGRGAARAPEFPKLTPGDLSTAASLPGSPAAMFLSNRIGQQASQKVQDIDRSIAALSEKIKASRGEIATLDKQLAKLESDKQKALADLRKQKEKALAEAAKAQDSRLIRVPTPTPKRP